MNLNTDTAYQPAARSSIEEQRPPRTIQRSFNGKPLWSKAFLITFWVLQIIICIIGWCFGAFGLVIKSYADDEDADTALRYALSTFLSFFAFGSHNSDISQYFCWNLHFMGQRLLHPHRHGDCHVLA